MKKILVIAAHPDDEILGCGGSIAKHVLHGDEVYIAIIAEGATSRDEKRDVSRRDYELSELAKAANAVKDLLGVESLTLHRLPDNRLDSIDLLDVIKLIESHLDMVRPEIVYTHHAGDLNIDHRRIHDAVVTACRPVPSQSVKTLLFFEVQSSTEWNGHGSFTPFTPNWYVDVSDTLALKMKALDIYQVEMRPWPHARSLKAAEYLARWRGSTIGVAAAEAFICGRHVASCGED